MLRKNDNGEYPIKSHSDTPEKASAAFEAVRLEVKATFPTIMSISGKQALLMVTEYDRLKKVEIAYNLIEGLTMNNKVMDVAFVIDQILNISREQISEEVASQKAIKSLDLAGNNKLAARGLAEYRKWHNS